MSVVLDVVARMVAEVFNERDAERRAAAVDAVFAADVVFTDPEGATTGRPAVAAKIQALLDGAPGFIFRLTAPIQEVADLGLDRWQFGPPDGQPVVRGTDVVFIRDGHIARLYTIVDPA